MAGQENHDQLLKGDAALKALERLVVENPELQQLEGLLSQFNLFEAIGAVRMEIRHSDFLAFLLNPSQKHGLGDLFLKRLLQKILAGLDHGIPGITPVHLDLMDVSDTTVRREWEHTDILCVSDLNHLVVLLENKIVSGEGEGQLQRYLEKTRRAFSGSTLIAIFLTPEGIDTSEDDSGYIAVSYSLVCKTLEELLRSRRSVMGTDVVTTITHYVEMLRRHIVTESEIADLARRIYEKHRDALDLILEHRPDEQAKWRETLEALIRDERQLELDHSSKSYVRFSPKEWDSVPDQKKGEGWTPTKRLVLFQFNNFPPKEIKLTLYIGPCQQGAEAVREKVFAACKATKPFQVKRAMTPTWSMVWSKALLSGKDFQEPDTEALSEKVKQVWKQFLADDLPLLVTGVKAAYGQ
jgi:hypothetical protein